MNKIRNFILSKYLKNSKPNLFLVGPPKTASTFIHNILQTSPEIYTTINKELRFFSSIKKLYLPSSWRYYKDCFRQKNETPHVFKYMLDSTPSYFEVVNPLSIYKHNSNRTKNVPHTIRETIGSKIKIIVVIRNPILRTISHYFHHIKVGRLQRSKNKDIFNFSKDYPETLLASNYAYHIQKWEQYFSKEQILYINYLDIKKSKKRVIKKIEDFLQINFEESVINLNPVNEGFDLVHTGKGIQINLESMAKANGMINFKNHNNLKKYILSKRQMDEFSESFIEFFSEAIIKNEDLKDLIRFYEQDLSFLSNKFPDMKEELKAHEVILSV